MSIENISSVKINYLRVSISDVMSPETPQAPTEGVEAAEIVYERDVFDESIKAFWLQQFDGFNYESSEIQTPRNSFSKKLPICLGPQDKKSLQFGIFGKKWW